MNRLSSIPAIANAMRQFEAMPERDQKALKILAFVLCLLVLYFLMWKPASDYMLNAQQELERNKGIQELVQSNAALLSSGASTANNTASSMDSQALVSAVTNLAKRQGVQLKRFEPSGESKVKVWLEDVPFDKMIAWLTNLEKSLSVKAEQVSIEKEEAQGMVSARITLSS